MKIHTAKPGYPAEVDIQAVRNDTFLYKIKGYTEQGDPFDFSSNMFKLYVKREGREDEDPIIAMENDSFTTEANQEGIDAAVSNILVIEHAEESMDVSIDEYVYDLEMTDSEEVTQTLQGGKFIITEDVTE